MRVLAQTCTPLLLVLAFSSVALAWDAHGHRTITLVAMDQFSAKLEGGKERSELTWLLEPGARAQIGFQAGEPDRYRAIKLPQLRHANEPDHYLDVEDLEQFGLTLRTIPPLRNEYLRAMAIAKHEHPDNVRPYNERTDPVRTQEWPGMLPFSIMEQYGKVVSSLRHARIIASLNDSAREHQLAAARASVIQAMGQLSHFVGDAAQPLHTTRHHHGWVGDNPDNFTTNRGFHAYIDTTVLGIHSFNHESLSGTPAPDRVIDHVDPWSDTLDLIERSFVQVRPLYQLQKSGELEREPGKAFIAERLNDAAGTLAGYYFAAWRASAYTEQDVKDFIRYDQVSPALPNPMDAPASAAPSAPAATPAPAAVPQ